MIISSHQGAIGVPSDVFRIPSVAADPMSAAADISVRGREQRWVTTPSDGRIPSKGDGHRIIG